MSSSYPPSDLDDDEYSGSEAPEIEIYASPDVEDFAYDKEPKVMMVPTRDRPPPQKLSEGMRQYLASKYSTGAIAKGLEESIYSEQKAENDIRIAIHGAGVDLRNSNWRDPTRRRMLHTMQHRFGHRSAGEIPYDPPFLHSQNEGFQITDHDAPAEEHSGKPPAMVSKSNKEKANGSKSNNTKANGDNNVNVTVNLDY